MRLATIRPIVLICASTPSPRLVRFRRYNVGLDAHVMVDEDLPLAATFCHHLQKTCAESAYRVEVKGTGARQSETQVSVSQIAVRRQKP